MPPPPAWGAPRAVFSPKAEMLCSRGVGVGLRATSGNARSLDTLPGNLSLPPDDSSSWRSPLSCPLNFSGEWEAGGPEREGAASQPLGLGLGVWEEGARSSLGSAPPLPPSPARCTRAPSPARRQAASQRLRTCRSPCALGGRRAPSLARGEENGVGCTYLSEFRAHQDEEEEAEELPGRLHVSLPPPPSWHAGALVLAPALRGRGRAPGSAGPAPSAPGASALHGERVLRAVPAVPGRGAALRGPSSCAPPPAPARLGGGAKSLRGRRPGGAEGPARHAHAREWGGRWRGSRLGQDVTSKRRGKFNSGEKSPSSLAGAAGALDPSHLEWRWQGAGLGPAARGGAGLPAPPPGEARHLLSRRY